MKAAFGNQREMVRSGHEAKLQVECQAVVSQLQEGKRQSDQLQTVWTWPEKFKKPLVKWEESRGRSQKEIEKLWLDKEEALL